MTTLPIAPRRLDRVTGLVAALIVVDVALKPECAWAWLLAVAAMVGIRLVVRALMRSRHTDAQRRALVDAGVLGGLVLAAGLAVAALRGLGHEHGWATDRALGIVMSVVLLVMGNAIPKASVPPTASTCIHGSTATRRFAGWLFAGAGALGLAGWLFAPVDDARTIATVACFGAVALVLVRCLARPASQASD